MNDVVVVGSINMDLVVRTSRAPHPGETIIGSDFMLIPGGKGANQAFAASRLGGATRMLGCVGDDLFGRVSLESLSGSQVDVSGVRIVPDVPTGTASIVVEDSGENRIIIVPGANKLVTMESLQDFLGWVEGAKVLNLQFEIPLETNIQLIEFAHLHGVKVMLNPAPALHIEEQVLSKVDILVVNETEAEQLSGRTVTNVEDAFLTARSLNAIGVETVIVTLGKKGAVLSTPDEALYAPALDVDPVDTTAAGDTFVGGYAASLVSGKSRREALQFAVCAGSLVVTKLGAQTSIPTKEEVVSNLSSIEITRM